MAQTRGWIFLVKREFESSPLVSNMFFGLVLLCLEKLVEVEFACPCDPKYNTVFAAAIFVVPAVLVFLIMINIQGRKSGKLFCFSVLPAMVWLILVFLDGQYFTCGKTSWSGSFVTVKDAAHQKWCKPANNTSSQELMSSQQWFSLSQGIGMVLSASLTLPLGGNLIYKWLKKNEHVQGENVSFSQRRNDEDPEAPV